MTQKIKFKPSEFLSVIPKLIEYINTLPDKLFDIEIKQHRDKRSLDANSYFWSLCGKLADALNTDRDSLYIQLLDRYGVFTHVIIKEQAADQFKREYRLVKDLGEVEVNGKSGIQLQCYFGSSTYDTKQMSRLIDGTVGECRDLGIETMVPAELERIKEEWAR